jgi:hypothetical protein
MRVERADGSILEGTPEEIAQFEAYLRFHGTSQSADQISSVPQSPQIGDEGGDWEFVSADVAFRALTRIRLGKETKAVLRRLHIAGDAWTSGAELQREIGYKPSQFAGLMGAFARRVINTPGYVLDSSFFQYEWDEQRACHLYRLPPSSRAAVERARLIDKS